MVDFQFREINGRGKILNERQNSIVCPDPARWYCARIPLHTHLVPAEVNISLRLAVYGSGLLLIVKQRAIPSDECPHQLDRVAIQTGSGAIGIQNAELRYIALSCNSPNHIV